MSANDTARPNCYECRYRHGLPGDAHSCCTHPRLPPLTPLARGLWRMFATGDPPPAVPESADPIHVTGNPHGIRNGWFMWPVNFDPVWLDSCDGFEKKGGERNGQVAEAHQPA